MVRFIKVVGAVDKITDCIPVISLVKNISIIAYQRIHKVNKVANPVKAEVSWVDDLKIHALSKDDFIAGIAMLPIVGNCTAFIYHLTAKGMLGGPIGYLGEAIRKCNWGLKKHSYEVVSLYLARYPDRPEGQLRKALMSAASDKNAEIFELILKSRSTWFPATIKAVIESTNSINIAKHILKEFSDKLTDEHAGSVVAYFAGATYRENRYEIIDLLLNTYPNINRDKIGLAIENAAETASLDIIQMLFDRFPQQIDEKYINSALKKTGNKDVIEWLFKKAPGLITTHLDTMIESMSRSGNTEILRWLLATYEENVTEVSIGKILANLVSSFYWKKDDSNLLIKELISKYPDLPGKDLEPALKEAASLNIDLFKMYLNGFKQLKSENLQKILNDAVFIYGKYGKCYNDPSSVAYAQKWKQVAKLIQTKFPNIQATSS